MVVVILAIGVLLAGYTGQSFCTVRAGSVMRRCINGESEGISAGVFDERADRFRGNGDIVEEDGLR